MMQILSNAKAHARLYKKSLQTGGCMLAICASNLLTCPALAAQVPGPGTQGTAAEERAAALLNEVPGVSFPFEAPIIRQRAVKINSLMGMLRATVAGGRLGLNLFSDANFVGEVEDVEQRSDGTYTVLGRLKDHDLSSFALSVNGEVMVGNIRHPGRGLFQIRYAGNGLHLVQHLNEEQFPPCITGPEHSVPPVKPNQAVEDLASSALPTALPMAAADTGTTIDLMVVYTPSARSAAGGTAAMQALINLSVDESNVAYRESGINPRLRLVYQGEVAYVESRSFQTDLNRLTSTTDGYIDNIHSLRQTYGADAVSLLINDTTFCGIGWVMTSLSSSFAANAFTVVHYGCATGYYSLAHELGHNMGCMHDRQNSSSGGLYSYSYGWRFTGLSGEEYRDIMSYAPGLRIQRFSNPDVLYDGVATGVPVGQVDEANNALTINNSAYTFANFRQSTFLTTPVGLAPGSAAPDSSVLANSSPVTLSWNSTSGADRYQIAISYYANGSWTFLNTYNSSVNSLLFTPPVTGTYYSWQVMAGTATLNSSWSPLAYFYFQPGACTYSLAPTSASYPANGGSGSITVNAVPGCNWTASSSVTWITLAGVTSGTGNGSVNYSVAANTSTTARSATFTVAGQTFAVSQAGASVPCSFSLSSSGASMGASGGPGSVAVTTQTGCSWTASSSVSWITVTSGNTGSGSGSVAYSVAANGSTSARSANLTIAGQTFTVGQEGATVPCSYALSSTGVSVGANGGPGTVAVTTPTGCSWTASSSVSWVTVTSGASGNGNGSVNYSVGANSSTSARSATVTLAGQPFTISQAGAPVSCSYSLSSAGASVPWNGGSGSFSVNTGSTCSWAATSNAAWLNVTTGANGTGNGTVTYSVTQNKSKKSRTGSIVVQGVTFTVTQGTR